MERTTTIVEMCPGCGSLDVDAAEPAWFAIRLERRSHLDADGAFVDRLEFGCRDCGIRWD